MAKAEDYIGDLSAFGKDNYARRKDLTKRLDSFKAPFTLEFINEIVLWKIDKIRRHVKFAATLGRLAAIKGTPARKREIASR